MIGRTFSHYRIEDELGRGGMGVAYKALDLKLGRPVVLKFLSSRLRGLEEAKRRFLHEARAASALDHPNICTIYEIAETPDGQTFIAMSYYEGQVLSALLDRGPMPIADALDIATQVAEGLAASHARGIIHRDVKPGNVVVTTDGVVKLLDFGLAKLAGASRITKSGFTFGTAAYMSPQQLRGEPVDGRADVWSLGVVLYEMIAGRRPFSGRTGGEVVQAILTCEPRPLRELRPDVPKTLEATIARMLAKHPERRASAGELLAELSAAAADAPPGDAPLPPMPVPFDEGDAPTLSRAPDPTQLPTLSTSPAPRGPPLAGNSGRTTC